MGRSGPGRDLGRVRGRAAAKGHGRRGPRTRLHDHGVRVSDTDATRDPSALCSDVLRHLGLSHEAAARLAGEWRTLPREQMLHLRLIKNMLTPLLPVRGLLERDDPVLRDTHAYLKLIPRLP